MTLLNYIKDLSQKTDKDSRINHDKINDYIEVLSKYGKAAGKPYMKHIDGDIWELRPIRGRIFFANWTDNGFILLHHFQFKKTQKTPKREIDQAKRNLADIAAARARGRRGGRPKTSDEKVTRALKMYDSGFPVDEVCKSCGLSKSTLYNFINGRKG